MRSSTLRNALLTLSVTLGIALLIYGYTAIYIRYIADDYCTINVIRERGVPQASLWYYFNWNGRFIGMTSILATLPLGFQAEMLVVLVTMIVWWLSLFALFSHFTQQRQWAYPRLCASCATSLTLLTILNSSPSLFQSIFWPIGLLLYTMPLVIFTIYLWLVFHQTVDSAQVRGKSWILLLCAVLTFVAAGCNEIYALMQTVGLFGVVLLCWMIPGWRGVLRGFACGFIGSLLATIITMIAPGNFVRLAASSQAPGIGDIVLGTVVSPLAVIVVTSLFWPIAWIVIIFFPAIAGYYFEKQPILRFSRILGLLLGAALLIMLNFCFFFVATGNPPPQRTWIIPQFVLLVSVGVASYLISAGLRSKHPHLHYIWKIAGGFLLIAVVGTSIVNAIATLNKLRDYANAWEERDRNIRNSLVTPRQIDANDSALHLFHWKKGDQGQDTLIVSTLNNPYGLEDLTSDPHWWPNVCTARYYGIPAIMTLPDTP
jgi:hypothetical protein